MNHLSSARLISVLLALVILSFSVWQFTKAIILVQNTQDKISHLQLQTTLPSQISAEKWVISAPSHGAAGATLQARLRASARTAGVSLTRVEIQPTNKSQAAIIRASAQANGSIQEIARFIYQLESTTPALMIERARFIREEQGVIDLDLELLGRMSIEANP